jgi:hypothetical protein
MTVFGRMHLNFRQECIMTYKATIELTGTASHGKNQEEFYKDEHTVEAETIGAVFDALAEKAYDMYFQLSMWLLENRSEDYSMQNDYWFVNCSWPSVRNPFNTDNSMGAGSALSDPSSFVQTVAHYRHMEVEGFINREVRYVRDGYYKRYVEGVKPIHEFFDVFHTDDVSKYLNYGYNGRQLDQVMNDMGEELIHYLKDYSRYRGLVTRGTPEKIIIPEKPKAPKVKRGFFKRLFGGS